MGFLKRISIKSFLLGIISILLVVLTGLSVGNVVSAYGDLKEARRLDIANELADGLLSAAGFAAKERGITAMVLSSGKAADQQILDKIREARTGEDEALKKAFEDSERLIAADPDNTLFASSVNEVKRLKEELDSRRRAIDRELLNDTKGVTAQEWIRFMTSVIDATAEARLTAFSSRASEYGNQEALRMNLELKQAVWLVSEYAGRERATLAHPIASRTPVEQATLEKLNTFRAIVDINTKPILRLKATPGIDREVLDKLSAMEAVYLGRFEAVRKGVYAGALAGEFPVTGKEWVEKSSEAIDSIIGVSAAVGKMVDDKVMADLAWSKKKMFLSAALLAVVLFLGIFSMTVIKRKVVSPMVYLSNAMSAIESSNDLTVRIEVSSEDENGTMARAFNGMIEKFREIVNDLHSSIEQLASSSEELSASAVQIAGGSQSQSSKAAQVSTATQEMSATIIEVAKNVSSAAEAAKDATNVATRGGAIVSETIASMNGISETARESSAIIEKLGDRSQEIGKIVNVIDDIADQTNLLALNAAIEAARAGEQGRGFAVVADEVRKLAEKTMTATKEIGQMIKAMQEETGKAITSMEEEVKAVESGVKLATEAGDALNEIVAKVDLVTNMVHQVTTATEQQSAATEQISGDITDVAEIIRETSQGAQQIARASEEIAQLATGLKANIEVFKVAAYAGSAAGPTVHSQRTGLRAA